MRRITIAAMFCLLCAQVSHAQTPPLVASPPGSRVNSAQSLKATKAQRVEPSAIGSTGHPTRAISDPEPIRPFEVIKPFESIKPIGSIEPIGTVSLDGPTDTPSATESSAPSQEMRPTLTDLKGAFSPQRAIKQPTQ